MKLQTGFGRTGTVDWDTASIKTPGFTAVSGIGYFCNTTNWKKKSYIEILDNARDIATYCDKNNWDSIWFTEHHLNHEGMESCANPLMMCTDIAARTKQIRLGQACNVITFWNPIRLAEDIATLDNLSNGRVEVGVCR